MMICKSNVLLNEMMWLASSHYEIAFLWIRISPSTLSYRRHRDKRSEDARFVRFADQKMK